MSAPSNHRTRNEIVARAAQRLRAVVLLAAFASFLLSVYLFFVANEESQGIFVGLWVPSILSLGAVLLTAEQR